MIINKKTANAVGGRTAHACDSCLRKRARWFCAADDAFLCQSCDASVHSANQLANRHERVRLETASTKTSDPPAWHHGFTRKARTPRNGKPTWTNHHKEEKSYNPNPVLGPLVPEIGTEDLSIDENEEDQLLYRVPIYDPFVAELCDVSNDGMIGNRMGSEARVTVIDNGFVGTADFDMDLTDFDVESLLGKGLDDEESFGIKELGLLDCKEEDVMDVCFGSGRVKVEDDEDRVDSGVAVCYTAGVLDATRETLDWNFDYESPVTGEEEEEEKVVVEADMTGGCKAEMRRSISLRLDYEGVITAWAGQGSPWTMGCRPELNPDDSWPDFMGSWTMDFHQHYGETGIGGPVGGGGGGGGDGGREARVSRYREKRRTRLFSKKIRYEVRKLNAEKRPRMKGRFVKRTPSSSFQGSAYPLLNK